MDLQEQLRKRATEKKPDSNREQDGAHDGSTSDRE
ncbi:hypothetical protein BN1263560091 [Stenotrophomonas indicatrix]|nr:hypothetical protein [Stenotrophomonas sp. 1337]CRD59439.1 hypothetical protein BN1263560091 [Stenotrophomonas indicatrix]